LLGGEKNVLAQNIIRKSITGFELSHTWAKNPKTP